MDIETFLSGSERPGYMVAVVGHHAPRFVHVGETPAAARDAAINEAERLLKMAGCGRALVLRLDAVVDQSPAELPPATVNRCRPDNVEMTLDDVTKVGLKLASLTSEVAALRAAGEEIRHSSAPVAGEKPKLIVREHGIYERADGKIVAWEGAEFSIFPPFTLLQYKVGGVWYSPNGECSFWSNNLVREIVAGEGWRPWNGGGIVVLDAEAKVDIVTRQSAAGLGPIVQGLRVSSLRWSHEGKPDDILAYREA